MSGGVPIFHGRITLDGKFLLEESERDRRRVYFESLAGKSVEIIVRKVRVQRSVDQNAYIHGVVIPPLADHCGYSTAEMKFVLMGECWGWKTIAPGREIPEKIHTSDMTVEEATRFIDWVIPWAMEQFNIPIPLPNEAAA